MVQFSDFYYDLQVTSTKYKAHIIIIMTLELESVSTIRQNNHGFLELLCIQRSSLNTKKDRFQQQTLYEQEHPQIDGE